VRHLHIKIYNNKVSVCVCEIILLKWVPRIVNNQYKDEKVSTVNPQLNNKFEYNTFPAIKITQWDWYNNNNIKYTVDRIKCRTLRYSVRKYKLLLYTVSYSLRIERARQQANTTPISCTKAIPIPTPPINEP